MCRRDAGVFRGELVLKGRLRGTVAIDWMRFEAVSEVECNWMRRACGRLLRQVVGGEMRYGKRE